MVAELPNPVCDEIRRVVEEAAENGGRLSLSAAIERVLRACPDRHPSTRYLTSEILIAATSAMVAVEMDPKGVGCPRREGAAFG
jgi:hypothetical protein